MKRAGYVCLLGLPNAGKSTLMNACIGRKLAAVSARAQTTRRQILGIAKFEQSQLVFCDTPGIHDLKTLNSLNKSMLREAWESVRNSDVVCYLIDMTKGLTKKDIDYLTFLTQNYESLKILLFGTKKDKFKKALREKIWQSILLEINEKLPHAKTKISKSILISSKDTLDIETIKRTLSSSVPEGEWIFEDERISDKPKEYICAELIRENIFRDFSKEIPYKCAVQVTKFEESEKIVSINAEIIVETKGQKIIIIGKSGEKIKAIGMKSRHSIEDFFKKKVFLSLFVKVIKNWTSQFSKDNKILS